MKTSIRLIWLCILCFTLLLTACETSLNNSSTQSDTDYGNSSTVSDSSDTEQEDDVGDSDKDLYEYNRENLSSMEIPSIEAFSGTEYEDHRYHFPPVASAVFIHDGKGEPIAKDDPRLIRMLNFLTYSKEIRVDWWRQGYVLDDEIKECLASDYPMIDVRFNLENGADDSVLKTPRIIVCGHSYLILKTENHIGDKDDMLAEQYWPYADIISAKRAEGLIEYDSYSYGWGRDDWLNIPKHAGFIAA